MVVAIANSPRGPGFPNLRVSTAASAGGTYRCLGLSHPRGSRSTRTSRPAFSSTSYVRSEYRPGEVSLRVKIGPAIVMSSDCIVYRVKWTGVDGFDGLCRGCSYLIFTGWVHLYQAPDAQIALLAG
jgi:hypothetical protein